MFAQYWIDAQDAVGIRLYRWHDDIDWKYNCQTITEDVMHYAYPSDTFTFEKMVRKLTDTMTQAGSPSGIANGQAEMAACVGFSFFSGCFDNSYPYIYVNFDAFGNSKMTGYGA